MSKLLRFPASIEVGFGKPQLVRKDRSTCPVVDGAILNPETHEIAEVKGFVKVSDTIVVDPEAGAALPIGKIFFFSVNEAKLFLIKSYRETAKKLTEQANEIEEKLKIKATDGD